MFRDIVLNPYT